MSMIQNAAIFQDVVPVATIPSARGTAAAPLEQGGGFAELLQGKWPSRTDGSAADETAAKGDRSGQAAKVASLGNTPAPVQQNGQVTDPARAQQLPGLASGGAEPGFAPGQVNADAEAGLRSLMRKSLAAGAQNTPPAEVAQQISALLSESAVKSSASTPTPKSFTKGDGEAVRGDIKRTRLAAEAQQITPDADTARQGSELIAANALQSTLSVLAPVILTGVAGEAVPSDSTRNSLAAEAWQSKPAADAARQGNETFAANPVQGKTSMPAPVILAGSEGEAARSDFRRNSLAAEALKIKPVDDPAQQGGEVFLAGSAGGKPFMAAAGSVKGADVQTASADVARNSLAAEALQVKPVDDPAQQGGEVFSASSAGGKPFMAAPGSLKGADVQTASADVARNSLAAEALQVKPVDDPAQQGGEVFSASSAGGKPFMAAPGSVKGADVQTASADVARNSLAAEAQQMAPAANAVQHEKATQLAPATAAPTPASASVPNPIKMTGADGEVARSDFKRNSLAAEARQIAPAADTAQQGSEVVAATSADRESAMPAPDKLEVGKEAAGHDLQRKSLVAQAQQIKSTTSFPNLGADGRATVSAGNAGLKPAVKAGNQQEILEAAAQSDLVLAKLEQGTSLGSAPGGQTSEQPEGGLSISADAVKRSIPVSSAAEGERVMLTKAQQAAYERQTRTTASQQTAQTAAQTAAAQEPVTTTTGSNPQKKSGDAVSAARQAGKTAEGFIATPAVTPSLQAVVAAPATDVKGVPAEQVPTPSVTGVETQPKAAETQAVSTQSDSAKLALQGEAQQPELPTGATEGAQPEVSTPGSKGQASAATGAELKQQQLRVETNKGESARVETAQAQAAPIADRSAQAAGDRRDPRTAEGVRGAAEKNTVEQAGVTQKASADEISGTKTASATAAKLVPSQAGSAQQNSSDTDQKGQPEQKAPGKETEQIQPSGLGMQAQVAELAAQHEAKPVNLKGALHESLLSQIKDGAITHDGKGNGEMSIRLNPGELGELKIQVRMEDNRLRVEVHADNRMVKDLLMSNLDSLKEALSSKNFTMEGFDVSTGGSFNSPLPEERGNSRQHPTHRSARGGGYATQEEGRVNYLTADVNNLLDVRF